VSVHAPSPPPPGPRDTTAAQDALDEQVVALVRAAAAGDREAWDGIVRRYVSLLWAVALRHGLNESDAGDVVQTTWLRLLEHIDDIRQPARLGSWLATTAQREALRCIAHRRRNVLGDDAVSSDRPDLLLAPPDERLITDEMAAAARSAMDSLPVTWRSLVELLISEPTPTYEEIGADLGLPIGSIGPTRGRCVRRLRAAVEQL
jgi:RNA polymerase sigma factor (sigma-70 family)